MKGRTLAGKSVAYIYPYLFHYRAPFHELLRARLQELGVAFNVIYSSDPKFTGPRGDLVSLPWATDVRCTKLNAGGKELRYQHAFREALKHDLIVLQQENGLLVNYPLILGARLLGKKVAYFGHGKNFQTSDVNSLSENFKRYWIDKVDWWFAYTEATKQVVAKSGFPEQRITVFNNAIDMGAVQRQLATTEPSVLDDLRRTLVDGSENVAVFVGALYEQKRLPFLVEAADRIRARVPDFHLLVVGGGPYANFVQEAAQTRPWLHPLGPLFGQERTDLISLSKLILMPGLVGLVILDSFACGVPLVTTNVSYHSPEISYLNNGKNGLSLDGADDIEGYVEAVIRLLTDERTLHALQRGALASAKQYSLDEMVARFSQGVVEVLSE